MYWVDGWIDCVVMKCVQVLRPYDLNESLAYRAIIAASAAEGSRLHAEAEAGLGTADQDCQFVFYGSEEECPAGFEEACPHPVVALSWLHRCGEIKEYNLWNE